MRPLPFALCCALLLSPAALHADESRPGGKVEFNRDIRPILSDTCYTCHGPAKSTRKAGLRLDTQDGLFADEVVVPGQLGKSKLWERVSSPDPKQVMPPSSKGRPLTAQQIEVLREWIVQGASWQNHWAFI